MRAEFRNASALIVVGAIAVVLAGPASGAGFYLQEQSVKGLGRAYSGEAADTGPESLWWNPAAIAAVDGIEIYAGAHLVLSDTQVSDLGSTIQRPGQAAAPVGGAPDARNPLLPGLVPNLDAAWRLNDHLALGLAVSAPFDFTTKYNADSFTRYEALTSRLVDLDVQPTIGLHVNRYLDLGAGFDAQYAKARLSSALPNLSPLLPDGFDSLAGAGWNYGWTVGAQLHPARGLSLGVSYRSKIDHQLNGSVTIAGLLGPLAGLNGALPGVARFSTPWLVVVGARYALGSHWTLNAQLQRVGWSEFDAIRVRTPAGLTTIPQGYHDTTTEAVGVDYRVNPRWTLRAGLAHDPTPTPDIGRSARVPDGDRILATVGATVHPSRRVELDVALGYVQLQRSPIDAPATAYAGTPAVTPIVYDGEASGHAFILSSGVKFKF